MISPHTEGVIPAVSTTEGLFILGVWFRFRAAAGGSAWTTISISHRRGTFLSYLSLPC